MNNRDGESGVASSTSNYEEQLDPREVHLDPYNPRLREEEQGASQEELLTIMLQRFNIDELAESILEAGFLDFDPIIGWRDEDVVYVREGNRRIATLQLLLEPNRAPERYRAQWQGYAEKLGANTRRSIESVRIAVFPNRDDDNVTSYVGFRHVAGVRQWPAHEKAAFIAELVEEHGWSYEAIANRLGSYPRHVERHYIAHRIVKQAAEQEIEGAEKMSRAFGVLLRALQAIGVREFLGFEYPEDPSQSRYPIPDEYGRNLEDFVRWTFGTSEKDPVLEDSRQLTKWGRILQVEDAVEWLRRAPDPDFDRAWMKSGGQAESLADTLLTAADRLEESVPLVRRYQEREEIRSAIDLCTDYISQILQYFPDIAREHGLVAADV